MVIKNNGSILSGKGLATVSDVNHPQIIVGKYNKSQDEPVVAPTRSTSVFMVGAGSSAGTSLNALRVREDGVVLVNAAGDISMGGFQEGERP
jgi:hypothetical protein